MKTYPVKFSKVRQFLKKQKCTLATKNNTTETWENGKYKTTFKIQYPLPKQIVKMRFDELKISIEHFDLYLQIKNK